MGRELFPASGADQFQFRFRAPTGTRVVDTERMTRAILDHIEQDAGAGNVQITLGYVGAQASSYPINTVFLWTSGPQEAFMRVALRPGAHIEMDRLKERLRQELPKQFRDRISPFRRVTSSARL